MSNSTNISVRVDDNTKTKAVDILHSLGLNTSQAITMFLKQVIYKKGLPFDVKIPNQETIDTFNKTDAGKELHRVSNIEELKKEFRA